MPNFIKYSTTGDTQSLKKGNFYFGVGDVGKGPTSITNYWNGITPPTSGYTIYIDKASNGPSIYVATGDTQLINFTKGFSGQNFTGSTECLNWYLGQSNYACVNRDYESIVTSGLTLCLDAGFTPSYSTSGVTWYDLGYSGSNGTLINGPTFNSLDGGSIVFDGVDDYAQCAGSFPLTSATIITWIRRNGSQMSFAGVFFTRGGQSITGLNFYYDTNKIGYHWNASYWDFDSNLTIPDLTWCMVALSVTSTSGILYLCQSSGITTATNTNSHLSIVLDNIKLAQDDTVTQYGIYRFFKGNISISQVYNRALSSNEITQNFNAQKGRFGL